MAGRRLLGAIIDGVGLEAGRKLFDEAAERVAKELDLPPEDPKAAKKAAAEAEKARKAAEQEVARAKKAAQKAAAQRDKQVERDLAALKKKLGR